MKEIATGMPANSKAVEPPRRRSDAVCQDISTFQLSSRRYGVVTQADVGRGQPVHAENEFNREQYESERKRRQRPPFRCYQCLDVDRAGVVARRRNEQPVPDEIQTAKNADTVAEPCQQPSHTDSQGAQNKIDTADLSLPQQPRRGQ